MESPEFLKPRLRLYLSADIVGSTALKQSRLGAFSEAGAKSQSSWFSVIQGFYIEARRLFLAEWNSLQQSHNAHAELFGDPPKVWKTVGDEVLFVKILTDHRQLAVVLRCWIAAVRRMRRFLKERDDRLDVKCAAWTAGFPLKNKEVVINSNATDDRVIEDYFLENGRLLDAYYRGETTDIEIDFIGPSIDIGFRLASFASSRKFVVGVDIAYIISLTRSRPDGLIEDIQLYYEGSHPMRGVFGGVNYPVFWLDMSELDELPRYEDHLTNVRPADQRRVQHYCEVFHKEYASYTFRPFIRSETEQVISEEPPEYDGVLTALIKNFALAQSEPPEPQDVTPSFDSPDVEQAGREIIDSLAGPAAEGGANSPDTGTGAPVTETRSLSPASQSRRQPK